MSAITGTPCVTFTCSSASNGFRSGALETPRRCNNSASESCRQTYSAAACVPNVVVPARIRTDLEGSMPGTNPNQGIVLRGLLVGRAPEKNLRLIGLRVGVNDSQIALTESRCHALKNEFPSPGDIQKS